MLSLNACGVFGRKNCQLTLYAKHRQCRFESAASFIFISSLNILVRVARRIDGSVVEFSPATRETGVRFPVNAAF